MTNHIHMVIEVGDIPLSKVMQSVSARYAGYYNKKNNRIGHLFQGRYLEKLVVDSQYLLELCFYIHQNPVKANMVSNMSDYLWSSHSAYRNRVRLSWLFCDPVLRVIEQFSGEASYEAFIQAKIQGDFDPKFWCI